MRWGSETVDIWPEFDGDTFAPAGWTSSTGASMVLDIPGARPDRIDGYDFWRGYGDAGSVDYNDHPDGLLQQKTFSYNGTQRYRATFAYDSLKRVVSNDLFKANNNQIVQDAWTYDLLGNFQVVKTGGPEQHWDGTVRFSEPGYIDDDSGNLLETLLWDNQGRLTDRLVAGGDTYRYDYDGAGRLDNAEVNGKPSYYGYNVDDELIFDNHKGYRVYRFGSYRYSSNDKRVIVKPVPQVALLTQSGKTTSRWVFLEPDGHAFESAGDIEGQAQELSFDILGAYGRTLASSGDVLPIDGFHGADADPGRGVVPFGVRHVVKDVGMWMQPEPLLYLGLASAGPGSPRSSSGVYANANPVAFNDRTGFDPVQNRSKARPRATKSYNSIRFSARTGAGQAHGAKVDNVLAQDSSLANGLADVDDALSSGGEHARVSLDGVPTRNDDGTVNLGGIPAVGEPGMTEAQAADRLSEGPPTSVSVSMVANGARNSATGDGVNMDLTGQLEAIGHELSHLVHGNQGKHHTGSVPAVNVSTGATGSIKREDLRASGIGGHSRAPISANSVLRGASLGRVRDYGGLAPLGEP